MEVNQEIRASKKAHKREVLEEIERNRVESFDTKEDCDFYGNSKTGRRVVLTDCGVYNHRGRATPLHASQSLDNQSQDYSDGDAQKIDESRTKFQTLPRLFRSKKASGDRQPKANKPQPDNLHGQLYKTSRGKITSNVTRGQHEPRQRRWFQLTEHSLEYSQTLQRVNVRRQFPLTSIYDIVYNAEENPQAFILQFRKSEILLEADNERGCELWVKAIKREWNKWPKPVRKASVADRTRSLVGIAESSGEEQGEALAVRTSIKITGEDTPLTEPTSPPNEAHSHKYLRQESDVSERNYRPDSSLTKIAIQKKLGLLPRIRKSKADEVEKRLADKDYLGALRDIDFVMTKYPRKNKSNSLPHERVFTMDCDNLLIMWRHTEYSKFNQLKTILAEHIVEVKEGQNSDGFDRYPYEELEDQSLSILIEGEIQAGPAGNNTYAVLQSLDLVCESREEQKLWCEALRSLIHPKKHLSMYSNRFESTDPTILWLKSHWILISEGKSEIKEDEALVFGQSVVPQMSASDFKSKLNVAYQYNLRESSHHGNYLYWDSFILFYSLLCEIDGSSCLLLKLYRYYAKDYPDLGMTKKEFEKFLIEQQCWSATDAEDQCEQLIERYDNYHEPFKMYLAKKKPDQFQISLQLFSFAGFLSFLRSVDNCIIDRKHETVYQDMTQPLSHYFINSSHNTYLEGHQLTGLSTTDAYVRALLQGCRCLELDCWDGANGQPKITHGNTLVSDLSFEEVVETINKYAFRVSKYPLILSLENHCSETQQVVMAQTFQKIFGDKLVKQDTDEQDGILLKLPSPEELKEKIILKGRRRSPDERRPSDERGGGFAQRLQRTMRLIYRPNASPVGNSRSDLLASQQNLEVTNKQNSLESGHSRSDEQDNITIASDNSDKTESDEEYKPEYEEDQKKLHEDLSKLIVYCQAKHISPWSWQLQKQTPVSNMFSFSENNASSKCKKHPKEMLVCTERQFVRTYPAGTKIDSSNYDPIPMWNHGIHMVALNIQTPGFPIYLNQGKFRQNGGCGYVLKPKIMRDPNETVYNPNTMTHPHHAVTPVNLEVTLLSGQNFIIPNKKTSTMEILCQTYGIPCDCQLRSHGVSSENTSPLWPQFNGAPTFKKRILMPELCLVLFAVNINVHHKLKAGTLLGQNVFSLTSLKSGIHFIPLRKPGGDPISHVGIFVKIECSQEQASYYEAQPTSVSLENEISASQTHNGTDLESTGIDNGGHPKAFKLLRQQAFAADASSDC